MKSADLALALVALAWGATFVVVKRALGDFSPLTFLALRFALATLCLLPLLFREPTNHSHRSQWSGIRAGMITGTFLCAGYVFQTLGLQFTSVANSGFLTSLYIVLVPLLSALFFRRWPRHIELAGIALAGVGIILLTYPENGHRLALNRGDLLTLACALAFSLHLLVLGYYSRRERSESVAFGQIATVALICILSLPIENIRIRWSASGLAAIVITGILATAVAFLLQTWGQSHTTNTRAAIIFSLEPVFALLTAAVVGGEPITMRAIAGGSLVLGGVLLVELKGKPVDPQLEPAEEC